MALVSVEELLEAVLTKDASDLHICVGTPPILRINGTLTPLESMLPLTPQDTKRLIYTLMTQEQQASFEKDLELDFSFAFEDKARFRVNVYYDKGCVTAALRLIPTQIRTIEELKLPLKLNEIAEKHRGLFLVTGPTGSGKSTTLAAIIERINMTRACHIITIEDPIEYLFVSKKAVINQREVGSDTKSFAEALKRALRQDPDVIMIGEMRDLETISSAITAAETGHLVFATLHTPDAPQSIDRIVDVFPSHQQQQIRIQLSGVLVGICSQQLVPTVFGGRVVATELLIATPAVRNLIREAKTSQIYTIMQTGARYGMHTMDQCLVKLVKEGIVSEQEARLRAYDTNNFDRLLYSL